MGLNFIVDSHHINHISSKLTTIPSCSEIEIRYVNKILGQMAIRLARIINQFIINYQTVLSARIDKQDQHGQFFDEIDCCLKLK